jgi:hypothetical protein
MTGIKCQFQMNDKRKPTRGMNSHKQASHASNRILNLTPKNVNFGIHLQQMNWFSRRNSSVQDDIRHKSNKNYELAEKK